MTARIFKPTYLIEELGELGRIPDGATINIGGTTGPFFTVNGRALLFADGTSTGPGGSGITLQTSYDNGLNGQINLNSSKPFIISATNGKRLSVDPITGAVTIEGDLSVLGDTVVIDHAIQNVDQLNIRMPNPTTVGLDIRPDLGTIPTVNLLEVRNSFVATAPIFLIDAAGNTAVQNLTVSGTINGILLPAFYAAFLGHTDAAVLPAKHAATQISYAQGANVNVTGSTVQQALDSIETALSSVSINGVRGYEHTQTVASSIWTINHNQNSKKISVTIWDNLDELIFADTVQLVSLNTTVINFNTALIGRAVLMIF